MAQQVIGHGEHLTGIHAVFDELSVKAFGHEFEHLLALPLEHEEFAFAHGEIPSGRGVARKRRMPTWIYQASPQRTRTKRRCGTLFHGFACRTPKRTTVRQCGTR